MSIVHCNHCRQNIDTDYDAEHFVAGTEHCLIQVEEAAPEMLEALQKSLRMHTMSRELGYVTIEIVEWLKITKLAQEAIKRATE